MGKVKKGSKNSATIKESSNPVGIMSLSDAIQQQQNSASAPKFTPPVVKSLDSVNAGEREQACISLSSIILENFGEHVGALVELKVVHKLIQLLLDPFRPVRSAAVGALRNFIVVGGESMCELLVKQDVLMTISHALVQAFQIVIQNHNNTIIDIQQQQQQQQQVVVVEEAVIENIEDEMGEESDTKNNNKKNNQQQQQQQKMTREDEKQEALYTLYQVMIVLSFLCENSEQATQKLTSTTYLEQPLSHYMIQLLKTEGTREYMPLVKTTIQCLNVMTDENPLFNSQLVHQCHALPLFESFMSVKHTGENSESENNLHLRVTSASILFNIYQSMVMNSDNDSNSSSLTAVQSLVQCVHSIFSSVIQESLTLQQNNNNNNNNAIQLLIPLLPLCAKREQARNQSNSVSVAENNSGGGGAAASDMMMDANDATELQSLLSMDDDSKRMLKDYFDDEDNTAIKTPEAKQWKMLIRSQKMSFEILANIVSAFSMLNHSGHHNNGDVDMDMNDEQEMGEDGQDATTSPELAQFLLQSNVFHIVLEKCIQLSMQGDLESSRAFIQEELTQINETLSRGMNCLANILLETDAQLLAKFDVLKLWNWSFELCKFSAQSVASLVPQLQQQQQQQKQKKSAVESQVDMLSDRIDVLTGILWAILRSQVLQSQQQQYLTVLQQSAPLFGELSSFTLNEQVRMNSVGILGEIGKLSHSLDSNKLLAQVFSARLSDASLSVLSETLNAIFDVYGDVHYDKVLVESGLLKRMQVLVSLMQQRIQQNMKQVPNDVIFRAKEARLNLQRFIKYKANL